MTFIDRVLQVSSYQWADSNGKLVIPSISTLFKEAFHGSTSLKLEKTGCPCLAGLLASSFSQHSFTY